MATLTKPEPKTERFEARLTKSQKRLFTQAASLEGFSNVSEYVVHTSVKSAQLIIQKNTALSLTERDRAIFFKALQQPPKPTDYLRKSMKEYLEEKER